MAFPESSNFDQDSIQADPHPTIFDGSLLRAQVLAEVDAPEQSNYTVAPVREGIIAPRTLEELIRNMKSIPFFDLLACALGSGTLQIEDDITPATFDQLEKLSDENTPSGVKAQLRMLRRTYTR